MNTPSHTGSAMMLTISNVRGSSGFVPSAVQINAAASMEVATTTESVSTTATLARRDPRARRPLSFALESSTER